MTWPDLETAMRVRPSLYRVVADGMCWLPFTEFIPPGCWITSTFPATPSVHLVDYAVAVWDGDTPYFTARSVCGARIIHPEFHIEPPEGGERLCDGCALADFVPPVVVYRFFDTEGHLLYVGSTVNFLNRVGGHKGRESSSARWWPLMASHTCVEYPTQREALEAEEEAIRAEHPRFNRRLRTTAPRAMSRSAA